jgi:hypothetical protein
MAFYIQKLEKQATFNCKSEHYPQNPSKNVFPIFASSNMLTNVPKQVIQKAGKNSNLIHTFGK